MSSNDGDEIIIDAGFRPPVAEPAEPAATTSSLPGYWTEWLRGHRCDLLLALPRQYHTEGLVLAVGWSIYRLGRIEVQYSPSEPPLASPVVPGEMSCLQYTLEKLRNFPL